MTRDEGSPRESETKEGKGPSVEGETNGGEKRIENFGIFSTNWLSRNIG